MRKIGDHIGAAARRDSRADPVDAVFKYVTFLRSDADLFRCQQENIRGRLTVLDLCSAHHRVKKLIDTCIFQIPADQIGFAAACHGHFDTAGLQAFQDREKAFLDRNFLLHSLIHDPETVIAERFRVCRRVIGADHFQHMIAAGTADCLGKCGVMRHFVHPRQKNPGVSVNPFCIKH